MKILKLKCQYEFHFQKLVLAWALRLFRWLFFFKLISLFQCTVTWSRIWIVYYTNNIVKMCNKIIQKSEPNITNVVKTWLSSNLTIFTVYCKKYTKIVTFCVDPSYGTFNFNTCIHQFRKVFNCNLIILWMKFFV